MGVEEEKQRIREYVWRIMEERGIARFPLPVRGRIPNFVGAERAAENLRKLPEYMEARVIFCNPDSPQRPVRDMALRDGKILVMATPRLREGFLVLDPRKIGLRNLSAASTIAGAFRYGQKVEVPKLKIDLFVTGVVAVAPDGAKLGKGHGYGDLEYAILRMVGSIGPDTPVVATAHDLQVVERIPHSPHDVPVDIIVTPTRIIRTNTRYSKPDRILWEILPPEAESEIPILRKMRKTKICNLNWGTTKQFL